VAVLGGLASIARFLVDGFVSRRSRSRLPLGTLTVNVTGSLVLGLLIGLSLEGDGYLLLGTAVIGSYTTFSTWEAETHRLAESARVGVAAANILVSLALGLAAVELGRLLGGL
jgi:CrcB protein